MFILQKIKVLLQFIKQEYKEFITARQKINLLSQELKIEQTRNKKLESETILLFAKYTEAALIYNQLLNHHK